jgi:ParB-like chromosome segregation protein Spo0J
LGIIYPLICTPDRQILDGRERWHIAIDLKLAEVPVLILDGADARDIAMSLNLHRRQVNERQAALIIFELHPELRK